MRHDSTKSYAKTNFKEKEELAKWKEIVEKMYFPEDAKRGVLFSRMDFLIKNY